MLDKINTQQTLNHSLSTAKPAMTLWQIDNQPRILLVPSISAIKSLWAYTDTPHY